MVATRRDARGLIAKALALIVLAGTLVGAAPAEAQRVSRVTIWFLAFNTTQPPFDDAAVRRAVALGLDRAKIATAGESDPAQGIEPPGCLAHDPNARPYAFDMDQAKQTLASSGFKAEDYSELSIWVLSRLGRIDVWKRELEALTGNLTTLGLTVRLREFGNYGALERIATLPVVKMQYWGLGSDTELCQRAPMIEALAHSKGPFNYFGYKNSDVDALLDRAKAATDRNTKAALYREAQQKVLNDAVIIPVWWVKP